MIKQFFTLPASAIQILQRVCASYSPRLRRRFGKSLATAALATGVLTSLWASPAALGQAQDTAQILPGSPAYCSGIAVDSAGDIFAADPDNQVVWEYTAAGGWVDLVDSNGYDQYDDPLGAFYTFNPTALAVDSAGNVYIVDRNDDIVWEYTPANGNQIVDILDTNAGLSSPTGVAVDGNGTVYVADPNRGEVWVGNANNGFSPSWYLGNNAWDVAIDASNNVYTDSNYSGEVYEDGSYLGQSLDGPGQGLAVDSGGNLYFANPAYSEVYEWSPATGVVDLADSSVGLEYPTSVAVTSGGTIYVADQEVAGIVELNSVPAPVLSPLANNGTFTSESAPTISGTTLPGYTVSVTVTPAGGGSPITLSATADGSGNFSIPLPALADGSYTASVTVTDAKGETSPAATEPFTVTTNAPLLSPLPNGGLFAHTSTPTISGTTSPGFGISVTVAPAGGGAPIMLSTTADGAGNFSVTLPSLPDGSYTASVRATNPQGGSSDAATEPFTVATGIPPTAPQVALPGIDGYVVTGSPTIIGMAQMDLTVTITFTPVGGGTPMVASAMANASGQFSINPPSSLANGVYTVSAVSSGAGGSSTATVITLTVAAANFGAGTFQVIHAFGNNECHDGATLIQGTDGLIYGAALLGGTGSYGTIFKMNPDGSDLTVLFNFNGSDGSYPDGIIQGIDGWLYVTVASDGPDDGSGSVSGLICKIKTDGTGLQILKTFNDSTGSGLFGSLAQGPDGTLYGTTYQAGSLGGGSVYKINPDGSGFTILKQFDRNLYGGGCQAGVVMGKDGALYGAALHGGIYGAGTVYKINPDGTGFAILRSFNGTSDGNGPLGSLIQGIDGALYGTAYFGGSGGYGTVFKINTDGSGFSVLQNFARFSPTGGYFNSEGVTQRPDGTLFGLTDLGGAAHDSGVLFSLQPNGTGFATIRNLNPATDGQYAGGPLLLANNGGLYGSTAAGGPTGNGTIFRLVPALASPVVVPPGNNGNVNTQTPVITGSAAAGSTVTVTIIPSGGGSPTIVTGTANAAGVFSIAVPTLGNGSYTLIAVADAAGVSSTLAVSSITVEATPPAAPVVAVPGNGGYVNSATPKITGTAQAGNVVTLTITPAGGGTPVIVTGTAKASGVFCVTSTALTDGTYSVSATATDMGGNISPATTVSIVVDTVPPVAPVVALPGNNGYVNSSTPVISGSAEAGSVVTLTITPAGGGTPVIVTGTATAAGTFSVTAPTLGDGSYSASTTATDTAGNVSVATVIPFTVDTVPPVAPIVAPPGNDGYVNNSTPTITGTAQPGDVITVVITPSGGGAPITLTGTADASGQFSVTAPTLPDGSYSVSTTATDMAGNTSAVATSTVTVQTVAPAAPVVAVPGNGGSVNSSTPSITGTAQPGSVVTLTLTPAGGGATVTVTGTAGASGLFCIKTPTLPDGTYSLSATATDQAGNVSAAVTSSITVDTVPPVAPVVAMPGNNGYVNSSTPVITGSAEAGSVVTVTITPTGGGAPVIVTGTANGAGVFNVTSPTLPDGAYSVSVIATDKAGNKSAPTAISIIIETTLPIVTAPGNVTAPATSAAGAVVQYPAGSATDVVGVTSLTYSQNSGTVFPIGVTTVTVTAADAAGNIGTATFTVTVQNTTPPVITVPANVTVPATSSSGAAVTYPAATATDYVGTPTLTYSQNSGTVFPIGVTTVTVTATDSSGNVATKTFTVTVQNTTAPVITVPANVTVPATGANGATVTYSAATATDYVGTPTLTYSRNSGTVFLIGVTTVTVTATDGSGNVATKTFTVTVQNTTAPVITVPANVTVPATGANGATVTYSAATATDYVGTPTLTYSRNSGTVFLIGVTTVTVTATDGSGNVATKTFTVTVQNTTPPVITVPANVTVPATGANGATVTYSAATATDYVGTPTLTYSQNSGTVFPIGVTTVTVTATDSSGNVATKTFTVTVQNTTPPVIAVPANVTVPATGANGATVTYSAATATDYVGTPTLTYSQNSGTAFPIGVTTVTVTATDSSGNVATKTFTVTVQNTTPPVIAVPANVTVPATGANGATVTYSAATATDYVGTPTLTYSQNSGTVFPIGVTTVTVTARDGSGNVATKTFTVTVQNTTAPVITVPANVTVPATSSSGAAVTYPAATATDFVGVTSLTYSKASGTVFPVGVTIVTVTAKDAAGNVGTGTFTVTVGMSGGMVILQSTGESMQISGGATLNLGSSRSLFIDSSNSGALQTSGGAAVTASKIFVTGSYSSTGGSKLTPTPLTGQAPMPDPLAGLAVPSTAGMTTYSTSSLSNGTIVLKPGVYTNTLNIAGAANVTFSPGVYVLMNGVNVSGGATVTGTGVTLYNNAGAMSFSGGAKITLSPPATGAYSGVTLFQARNDSSVAQFTGGAIITIGGAYYFPDAQIQASGGTGLNFGVIVAASIQLSGGTHQCTGP